MRVVTDDGVGLEVVAEGSGPGLVLVHGFGGAKEDFADHLETLGRTHRVVAFDHRGHGASDKPEDLRAYSLRRLAADVLCVADAFGFDRFRLLGQSMGGMVAQHVALDAPERVEALVLMDTWPGSPPGIDGAAVERAARIALDRGMEELHRLMQRTPDPLSTPAHERLLRDRPGYREFCDRKFLALSPVMYAALVREVTARPDLRGELGALRCPTLVVAGEQDAALGGCRALQASIPGARLEVIADAGHSPQFENPEAWRRVVAGFLAQLPAR